MTTIENRRPTSMAHTDGIPWYAAPIPPVGHDCRPHTRHHTDDGVLWLERCPCGAARVHHPAAGDWILRDSRATGYTLSPSMLRLAVARARRRAIQHERQAVVTGDRQVVQCTYRESTTVVPAGARAYVVRINATSGHDRIVVLVRGHNGRWGQKWENTQRLTGFRVAILPPGHAQHSDRRIRTFSDDEARRFLAAANPAPASRPDAAAAMARVHAGGAR